MANTLRIGTCSWKYPSWAGLVYSQPKGIDYLAEYARRYDTVEVDQWFWALFPGAEPLLPKPADVEAYRRAVNADFRFTVKAPDSLTLTHYRAKSKGAPPAENPHFLSPDLAREFLDRLAPLRDVLGPVIFQFEYLNRQKMESQKLFEAALEKFRSALPAGIPYAVETRNPAYLNDRFLDFLLAGGWVPSLLQGYWMPPVPALYEAQSARLKKFQTIVLRLHGPERKEIEAETGGEWDRIVHPRDEELRQIGAMTRDLLGSGVEIYVNINNHYEGSAPLTINRFLEFLPKKENKR